MRITSMLLVAILAAVTTGHSSAPGWSMNATIIEACSCTMFCPCYFNPKPSAHHEHGASVHYCKFNNAFRVNHGSYGNVKLDGAKFWVSGDLGGDFSQGQTDWAVVTFDKSLSKEQREAIGTILGRVYPVKWNSLTTAEATIDRWEFNKETAVATMDGGKTAEVRLHRATSSNTPDPVVMKNLKYFGAPRNEGFIMMPNEVEAYRVGPKAYEYKGTNGFMITVDINSKDGTSSPKGTM